MIKKCLKSRVFWFLMSIIILVSGLYYGQEMYDYYGESFELIYFCVLMISNTICLINFSRKDGIRRLLSVIICSFAIFLFGNIGYEEDFFNYDLLYTISGLSFFFVCIPAGTLVLLKLVRKNKPEDETKNKNDNEDKKLIKKTRRKINKK